MENGIQLGSMSATRCFQTFESNILYSLRFMIDCKITGGQWVTLPENTYLEQPRNRKLTHCQYELHTHYSTIESHPAEGEANLLSINCICSLIPACDSALVACKFRRILGAIGKRTFTEDLDTEQDGKEEKRPRRGCSCMANKRLKCVCLLSLWEGNLSSSLIMSAVVQVTG